MQCPRVEIYSLLRTCVLFHHKLDAYKQLVIFLWTPDFLVLQIISFVVDLAKRFQGSPWLLQSKSMQPRAALEQAAPFVHSAEILASLLASPDWNVFSSLSQRALDTASEEIKNIDNTMIIIIKNAEKDAASSNAARGPDRSQRARSEQPRLVAPSPA